MGTKRHVFFLGVLVVVESLMSVNVANQRTFEPGLVTTVMARVWDFSVIFSYVLGVPTTSLKSFLGGAL